MMFSKYISKTVTPVMTLFQKQPRLPFKQDYDYLRQVPIRHSRGGNNSEFNVQFVPPTMRRLTSNTLLHYNK